MHAGPLPPYAVCGVRGGLPRRGTLDHRGGGEERRACQGELRAIELQRLDTTLHRLLPFALVLAFLIASVIVAFVNPIVGGAGLVATMAGVLVAYLTGRAPSVRSTEDQPPQQ